jgi:hypothetical protein
LTIRLAGPEDEDKLFDLLLGLEIDNGFLDVPRSDARVRLHIELGTRQKGGIHGVIDGPDGRLAGSIGIIPNQFWYSEAWFYQELWLFVRPEYRKGTGYADELRGWASKVKRDFEAGAGQEVPFFTSVSSRKRLDLKIRWWRRWGEQTGAIFLLR